MPYYRGYRGTRGDIGSLLGIAPTIAGALFPESGTPSGRLAGFLSLFPKEKQQIIAQRTQAPEFIQQHGIEAGVASRMAETGRFAEEEEIAQELSEEYEDEEG